MNNIPVFTAAGGTATLILKEIPYRKTAHVFARTWTEDGLRPLLGEAAAFCRMAGAQQVFGCAPEADGQMTQAYEKAWDMVELTLPLDKLPQVPEAVVLEPVTEGTLEQYRALYNRCFAALPNAATYTARDMAQVAAEEQCFLAMRDGEAVGVGQLHQNELRAIAVAPEHRGLGLPVAVALLRRLPGPEATLLVSTANTRALALYDRLGFRRTAVKSSWYRLPDQSSHF